MARQRPTSDDLLCRLSAVEQLVANSEWPSAVHHLETLAAMARAADEAEVMVEYTVPVVAMVNLDTRKVTKVILVEDEIKLAPDAVSKGDDWSQTAKAILVAEDVDWPQPWDRTF